MISVRDEMCGLGVRELGRLYRQMELSPVDVTSAALERIERLNPLLNAFISVFVESAMAAARAAELQLRAGIDLGPLHGIPVSVKDNIRVRGSRTTAASRVLMHAALDEEDATVVRRLRAAGAILLGKVNLHEFAFGAPDPDSPFGLVQNPRRVGFQAGTSSSGCAAAVGAGLSVISLGTDTGGSVRHPAGVSGLVGLKPTYGHISTYGVIPDSVYFDSVGPLARSVADVADALVAIAGYDPHDAYSVVSAVEDYSAVLDRDISGLRLGIPSDDCFSFGQPDVLSLVDDARRALVDLGLAPIPVRLPHIDDMEGISDLLITADLTAYHQGIGAPADQYGADFRTRVEARRTATAIQYSRARQQQDLIRRQWLELFERVDVLLFPSNLAPAVRHGVDSIEVNGTLHPPRMVLSRYGRLANLVGLPALALPVGLSPEGLPIGIQLLGPPFGESRLLAVGHALEQALGNLCGQWGIEPREEAW